MNHPMILVELRDEIAGLKANLTEQIEWVQRLADDLIAAEAKIAKAETALTASRAALLTGLEAAWRDGYKEGRMTENCFSEEENWNASETYRALVTQEKSDD